MKNENTSQAQYYNGEIYKYEKELKEANERNREKERQLRKLKNKVQHELDSIIETYDTDMTQKEKIKLVVLKQHSGERVRLLELREHFRKIDEEKGRIEEENSLLAAEVAKKEAKIKILNDAATVIQKIWKGHRVRKQYLKNKSKKVNAKNKKKK